MRLRWEEEALVESDLFRSPEQRVQASLGGLLVRSGKVVYSNGWGIPVPIRQTIHRIEALLKRVTRCFEETRKLLEFRSGYGDIGLLDHF